MVTYSKEIEKLSGVIKKEVVSGKSLFFVPSGTKFEFCSNDSELDSWCQNVKNKKVKGDAFKFVVNSARQSLKGAPVSTKAPASKVSQTKTSASMEKKVDPNSLKGWDMNVAATFNLYCQKTGMKYPDFKTIGVQQQDGGQVVSVEMKLADGKTYVAQGRDKQAARDKAIKQYAQEVLGVKFEEQKEKASRDFRTEVAEMLVEFPNDYKYAIDIYNPTYSIGQISKGGMQQVQCFVELETGEKVSSLGNNKNEAQQNAAKEFIKSCLKIDVDSYEQFGLVSEDKALSALMDLSETETNEMFDMYYDKNKKLPDVVQEFIEGQLVQTEEEQVKEHEYQEKEENKKSQELDKKSQLRQAKLALVDKQTQIISVQKTDIENGRAYDMKSADGTQYRLDISYGHEMKKKAVYRDHYDYFDGVKPEKYVEKEVVALNVSCQKQKDGKTEEFSLKTTSPHLQGKNPYRLDLMFLSNLKMTIKNTSVGHVKKGEFKENPDKITDMVHAYTLLKLLEAANDQIIRSPKLIKNLYTNKEQAIPTKGEFTR